MFSPTASDIVTGKVVLLGNAGAGKTSVCTRFIFGRFEPDEAPTVGASFFTKSMVLGDQKVKLQVWDTAGQDRFKSMQPMYYRGSHAAVLVADCTNRESFEHVKSWVDELRQHAGSADTQETSQGESLSQGSGIILCILLNKVDLSRDRKVSLAEAKEYAASIGATCYETSAKLNQGIDDVFLHIAKTLVERSSHAKSAALVAGPQRMIREKSAVQLSQPGNRNAAGGNQKSSGCAC
jgi:Ras-related protein Rab-21